MLIALGAAVAGLTVLPCALALMGECSSVSVRCAGRRCVERCLDGPSSFPHWLLAVSIAAVVAGLLSYFARRSAQRTQAPVDTGLVR